MDRLLEAGKNPNNIAAVLIRQQSKDFVTGKDADITLSTRLVENGDTMPIYAGEVTESDPSDNPTAIARIMEFAQEVDPDQFTLANHGDLEKMTTRGMKGTIERGAVSMYAGVYHYRWINASLRGEGSPSETYSRDTLAAKDKLSKSDFDTDGSISVSHWNQALTQIAEMSKDFDKVPLETPRGEVKPFAAAWQEWMDLDYSARRFADSHTPEQTKRSIDRVKAAARSAFDKFGTEIGAGLKRLADQDIRVNGEPVVLQRGLNCNNPNAVALFDGMAKGRTIRIDGMISTSADPSIAESFTSGIGKARERAAKAIVMNIKAQRGVALNPAEEEVIMNPGNFRVDGVRTVRNGHAEVKFVDLTQLVGDAA